MEALWNQGKFLSAVLWNWLWGEIFTKPFQAVGVAGIAFLAWRLLRPQVR